MRTPTTRERGQSPSQQATYVLIHKEPLLHRTKYRTVGFTLIEILVCLALLGILLGLALPTHLDAVEQAKAVEAMTALAEVVRLERLHYGDTGTYTSDFQVLGFDLASSLKYTQLFVKVQKDPSGWSYMEFASPLDGRKPESGWAVMQYAGGKFQSSLPGSLNSGGSPCSIWLGWDSMEGGRIEGEERLRSGSSTPGGGSPCAGVRIANQGKK